MNYGVALADIGSDKVSVGCLLNKGPTIKYNLADEICLLSIKLQQYWRGVIRTRLYIH